MLTDVDYSEALGVRLWYLEDYLPWAATPPLIDLRWIKGKIGLKSVAVGTSRHRVWATVPLDKASCIAPVFITNCADANQSGVDR